MENQSKLTKYLSNIVIVTVILLFVCFGAAQLFWDDGYNLHKPEIVQLTKKASLILEDGTRNELQCEGDYFFYEEAEANELLTLVMQLPEFQDNNICLCVFSTNQNIGVYIDGVCRQYYNDESVRLIGSYSASHYVMVPLQATDSGKKVAITYQTTLKESAGILTCPMLGTEADFMVWLFQNYFWQIVSALLILAVGIVFIALSIAVRFNDKRNQGLCYLGIFSIIMSLWILCQSNMRVFYCRNLNTTNFMTYVALMIAPIPKLMFMNDLMKYRYQKVFNVAIIACLVNIAFSLTVAFTGIVDLIEVIWTTRIVITVTCVISIFCFWGYRKNNQLNAPIAVGIGIVGFIIAFLIEDQNMLHANTLDLGKYIGFGIVFFLLMLGYGAEKGWIIQWKNYRRAIEENEFKNAFLANMSHEIKTPINTILGMNEMIVRETKEEEVRQYAGNIYEAGNMLLSLVNNVLDYTKLESGRMQIIPVRYEVGQLLSNVINTIRPRAEEKKLCFDVDIDKNIPKVLFGDELRITQAILNLLTNAIKYTKEGSISLRVYYEKIDQKDICLYISIKDTGVGIRGEDTERLYDSFVRLEERKNRSIEGAGLGLTITRQIMKMMQGDIQIESEYGEGSTFILSFKQSVMEEEPLGEYEDWYRTGIISGNYQENDYLAKGVKILVIDDNEMNLEVISGLLSKTQAQIDTALSGEEGLERARKQLYDLVLLDQMMPGMSGIETLHQMKRMDGAKYESIPIIALTADSVVGAREEYLQQGFTDYIAKPVDYRTLIVCIKKYLPDRIEKCSKLENKQKVCEEYLGKCGIRVKAAMKYVGDEMNQYIHLLEIFVSPSAEEKQELLQQAYTSLNWKHYTIYVHGLKNSARTIGADKLADIAYEHEQKSKNGEYTFIHDNYKVLVQELEKTKNDISAFLKHYIMESEESVTLVEKNVLDERKWEEIREQAIKSLEGYKKKEALVLLTQMLECVDKGKGNNLQQVMDAVKAYDYEKAVQLLREM